VSRKEGNVSRISIGACWKTGRCALSAGVGGSASWLWCPPFFSIGVQERLVGGWGLPGGFLLTTCVVSGAPYLVDFGCCVVWGGCDLCVVAGRRSSTGLSRRSAPPGRLGKVLFARELLGRSRLGCFVFGCSFGFLCLFFCAR